MNSSPAGRNAGHLGFIALVVALSFIALAPGEPSGSNFRRLVLSADPSLSLQPLEFLWGIFGWPFQSGIVLMTEAPIPTARFLPAIFFIPILAIGVAAFRRVGEPGSLSILLMLFFLGFVWTFRMQWDQGVAYTGPDVLGFGAALILIRSFWIRDRDQMRSEHPPGRRSFLTGLISGFGLPYFLLACPFFRAALRGGKPIFRFILFLLGFATVYFFYWTLHARYPNPVLLDKHSPGNFFNVWMSGAPSAYDPVGALGFLSVFAFPGMVLTASFLLSLGAVRASRFVWKWGAGQIVPVRALIYSIPVLVCFSLYGFGFLAAPKSSSEPSPMNDSSRWARALIRKLPSDTEIHASHDVSGYVLSMFALEGNEKRLTLKVKPRDKEGVSEALKRAKRKTLCDYQGANVLRMVCEPVAFSPQYLLNAETEVYSATPAFFVGNDPASSEDQPVIFYGEAPLAKQSGANPCQIVDWSYDGNHFYLYRRHGEDPWRSLGEDWSVSYSGYLTTADFESWGRRISRRQTVPLTRLYQ